MADWITYYHLEPWGPERADLNAAMITSMLANIHRDPKRRREPYTPADFMPKFGERKEPEQDGLAPAKVMAVMDQLLRHQERVVAQGST